MRFWLSAVNAQIAGESLGSVQLDVDGEVDFLAYHDSAGLEGLVPLHAEVLSVDDGGGADADLVAAEGTGDFVRDFGFERDLAGDSEHGQVAFHFVIISALARNALRSKRDLGVLVRAEEIGALEVSIPLFVPRGQAVNFDDRVCLALLRVRGIVRDGARDVGELAMNLRDHEMTNPKPNGRMVGVDGVSLGGGQCGLAHFVIPLVFWLHNGMPNVVYVVALQNV